MKYRCPVHRQAWFNGYIEIEADNAEDAYQKSKYAQSELPPVVWDADNPDMDDEIQWSFDSPEDLEAVQTDLFGDQPR